MSRHCPNCQAYPIASYRQETLVSIVIQHTERRCSYEAVSVPLADWYASWDYQPASRSRHEDLPPMENRHRRGTIGGRSAPRAASPRPARSHTADGRKRRR